MTTTTTTTTTPTASIHRSAPVSTQAQHDMKRALMIEHFAHSTMLLDVVSARPSDSPAFIVGIPNVSLFDWIRRIRSSSGIQRLQERWTVTSLLPVPDRSQHPDHTHIQTLWVSLDFLLFLLARGDAALKDHITTTLFRRVFPIDETSDDGRVRDRARLPFDVAVPHSWPKEISDTPCIKPVLWVRLTDLFAVANLVVHMEWTAFGMSAPEKQSSEVLDLVAQLAAPDGVVARRLEFVLVHHWNHVVTEMRKILAECQSHLRDASYRAIVRDNTGAEIDKNVFADQMRHLDGVIEHYNALIGPMMTTVSLSPS